LSYSKITAKIYKANSHLKWHGSVLCCSLIAFDIVSLLFDLRPRNGAFQSLSSRERFLAVIPGVSDMVAYALSLCCHGLPWFFWNVADSSVSHSFTGSTVYPVCLCQRHICWF